MKKRLIALFTAAAVACTTISASASTIYYHKDEFFTGKYVDNKQQNLCFFIRESAQTSILTKDVYKPGAWNDVSRNVNVSVEFEDKTNTSSARYKTAYILGGYAPLIDLDTGAITHPYDQNGKPCSDFNLGGDWTKIEILMNSDERAYLNVIDPTSAAKKVFLHEVGHALKLTHPVANSSLDEHMYSGYPLSVMNQGLAFSQGGGNMAITSEPTHHDRVTLIAKWGDEVV